MGEIPADLSEIILTEMKRDRVDAWIIIAMKVRSVEEFRKGMQIYKVKMQILVPDDK